MAFAADGFFNDLLNHILEGLPGGQYRVPAAAPVVILFANGKGKEFLAHGAPINRLKVAEYLRRSAGIPPMSSPHLVS